MLRSGKQHRRGPVPCLRRKCCFQLFSGDEKTSVGGGLWRILVKRGRVAEPGGVAVNMRSFIRGVSRRSGLCVFRGDAL